VRHDFAKLRRLPPYVLAEVTALKHAARRAGEDVIDLGMGNPDLPTPDHVVEKIAEAARNPRNHRYSASRGIPNLRAAACEWYARRHGVELDPETEAIAVIGAKEGLSHFVLVTIGPGDVVLAPDPTYPIHQYAVIIAGGDLRHVPLGPDADFRVSITNVPGAEAYPIASFTWLLIHPGEPDAPKHKTLRGFLAWMLEPAAQRMAADLHYAPLPVSVIEAIQRRLGSS
jgi:aspartate/methionine/tyrosine aminotransferase